MLKRAFSKLKLEHVVIGKGQFKQERKADGLATITVSVICFTVFVMAIFCSLNMYRKPRFSNLSVDLCVHAYISGYYDSYLYAFGGHC